MAPADYLFCSTPSNPLYFSPDMQPTVALPVGDYYRADGVQCGDLYYIRWENGHTLMARAYDAGPFALYCVKQTDGTCPNIGMDVPSLFWPLEGTSGWAAVYPISQWAREWRGDEDSRTH
jgi:hypothetical protein